MIQKHLILALLVAVLTIGGTNTALARDTNSNEDNSTMGSRQLERENKEATGSDYEADDIADRNERIVRSETMRAASNESIEARRAELQSKIANMKEKRKEKLEGTRLELCEKREVRINSLLEKSSEMSTKRLAVFQKIQQRVEEFYKSKSLSSDSYDTALANANLKAVEAVAANDVMASETFSCNTVDGAKPDSIISTVVRNRNAAMKQYKTAVKDLINAVKQSLDSLEATSDEVKTEGEQS